MSKKILLLTIFILILCLSVECQRGGGRSRSSSRSSSRRSSFGRSRSTFNIFGWLFGSDTNSTSNNETNTNFTNGNPDNSQESIWTVMPIIFIILGVFGVVAYNTKQTQKKRNDKIAKLMLQYEGKSEQNMCLLDDSAKAASVDWFMKQQWRIDFKGINVWENSYQVKVVDLKKVNDIKYEIKITGTDSIGLSTSKGLLTFQKDYIALFFEKSYYNRSQAGQTGAYDVLFYDGVQKGEQFSGIWYYHGFKGDPTYSGEWRMQHK